MLLINFLEAFLLVSYLSTLSMENGPVPLPLVKYYYMFIPNEVQHVTWAEQRVLNFQFKKKQGVLNLKKYLCFAAVLISSKLSIYGWEWEAGRRGESDKWFIGRKLEYTLVYEDNKGDRILVGDVP